jgi:hypothetical protein
MGQSVNLIRYGGNAVLNTLQVALTESSSLTRYVVADANGKVYYSTASAGGGGGTVTNVSVVTANGLAGSVANPTTTPAITLSTTITGLLKGDGTAISAATAGTDYITSTVGTASWAQNAVTASYFSGSISNAISASYAATASIATSASFASTASFYKETDPVFVSLSASLATTGSNIFKGNQTISGSLTVTGSITGSLFGTASWALNALTASYFSGSIISLTTNGNSGTSSLIDNVLNIPVYTSVTNGLVSGGIVSWSGTGWVYDVSAAYYYINGVYFTTNNTQVTLGVADISNPRLDIVAVNDQGQVIVIPGTPSSNPVKAQIDPTTEIELTTILVPAGATSPINITTSIIYDEVVNNTWTSSSLGITADFANATNPYTGVVCTSVSATTTGTRYLQFDRISGTDSISNYTVFKFAIRLGATWNTNSTLAIGFYNGNTLISTEISVLNGQFGFSSSTTGTYQLIQIPVANWRFTQAAFTRVRLRFINSLPAFRLDRVELQAGVVQTLIQANNIYTSDGSLAGIRTLTLNGNYLDIVGSTSTTRFNSSGSLLATGSLFGTASWAQNSISASYATTSSYSLFAVTASYIDPNNVSLFQITTGSITASVNVNPNSLFLIKSGSTKYLNISSSGDTDLYSNLFIVRNFTTQEPVFIVSQSIVQIQTQSALPVNPTNAGSIYFTSSSMYIGLEN